jgi:uncharacterized peroxidase-related enzyme
MARISLQSGADVPEEIQTIYETLEDTGLDAFMHQAQALAHHPPFLKVISKLLLAYYHESVVDQEYLELCVLAVSVQNQCEYCVYHHTPLALQTSLDEDKVQAVVEGRWDASDRFDETERLVLRYAEQISRDANRVDDALFDALKERFRPQQLVELTVRIAMAGFFNRFNSVLQLDMEPAAQELYQAVTEDGAEPAAESE